MPAASFSKSFGLSSGEEECCFQKQGIVSILGSDVRRISKSAGSLRRTLSADMSSKKWLAQNGFIKKTASSHQFPILSSSSSSSDGELEDCQEKEGKKQEGDDDGDGDRPGQFDIWTSIIQSQNHNQLPPPYIHPLVKRSTSSLSEKSLEICTENLGSETGSDGFSSYTPSETGDAEEEEEEFQFFDQQSYSNTTTSTGRRSTLPRTFPPPLPSLALSGNATPSLRVQPHRLDGRLVLEAVAVPPRNYFHASREGGRLLLSFVVHNSPSKDPDNNDQDAIDDVEEEEFREAFENEEADRMRTQEEEDEEEEEEEVEMENGIVVEQWDSPNLKLSSGVINVHRSAVVVKRATGIENINTTWTHKFNKHGQSLPPVARLISSLRPPAAAAAASFNAYEYFWRKKPVMATLINPLTRQNPTAVLDNKCSKLILSNTNYPNSPKPYGKQEMVLLKGNKADYLVPLSNRGCKEPRRSLLIWEPCCIATS